MRRLAPLMSAGLVLALSACDPSSESPKTASGRPAAPELSAPEPVSLHRPARVSTWKPEDAPAASSAYTASLGGKSANLEGLTADGARTFDGAGVTPIAFTPETKPAAGSRRIVHRAGMSIDTDGRIADPRAYRAVAARDRWRSNSTSLRYSTGRSLDPTRVPYVVLPLGYQGVRLGDLVYVEYRGRGAWAVVGDYGPANKFGEGSSALAAKLGIDPDGYSGGVGSGVTYTIYPGTARKYAGEHELKTSIEV